MTKDNEGYESKVFTKLAGAKVKAKKINYGINEFIPVIFADRNFSFVECLIHTLQMSILGFNPQVSKCENMKNLNP